MRATERVFNRHSIEKAVSFSAAVFFPAAVQAKPHPVCAERWSLIIAGQRKNVQGCVKVPHALPVISSKTNAGSRWIFFKTQGDLNLLDIPAPRKENPKFLMLP